MPADYEALLASGLDGRRAFEELLARYLFHAAKYPRISFANLHEIISEQRYTGPAVAMVHSLLDTLTAKLASTFPGRSRKDLRLGLGQIWKLNVATAKQLDCKSEEQCRRWARQIISVLDAPGSSRAGD